MAHLIFVFGTLKQGFRNFHVNRGRRVGGDVVTVEPHPLYIVGPRCLPWLLERPGEGLPVVGQLFEVDDETLAAMDRLEQVDDPQWYVRRRIRVQPHPGGGEAIEAWVYFGGETGFAGAERHAGPIAEYTAALAAQYPCVAT
ncbi:MAG: gamma-glutamylcyclotransferase [Burkholderiaceae bacterium]|nr:gamma-glutamylcyclotransferase [Burkholderiaceae bacterium]